MFMFFKFLQVKLKLEKHGSPLILTDLSRLAWSDLFYRWEGEDEQLLIPRAFIRSTCISSQDQEKF